MAHDVFISYSSKDKAIADAACATIERRQVRCWIAPRDVPVGDFAAALTRAVQGSRVLVLVLSSSSNDSEYVRKEIALAVSSAVVIVPLRIEAIDLHPSLMFLLSTIHWLDAMTPPVEKHLEALADQVALLVKGVGPDVPPSPPPPPPAPRRRRPRPAWIAAALGLVALIVAAVFAVASWPRATNGPSPIDPCAEGSPPPTYRLPGPAKMPNSDPARPLLPPSPGPTVCSVAIRNETGKRIRIWRHVHRPKGDPEYSDWRDWKACVGSPPAPPTAVAGWAYFVVVELDDEGDGMTTPPYAIAGWKFLPYGGLLTIRITSNFFGAPASGENFVINDAR